jgi:hypothetical protein
MIQSKKFWKTAFQFAVITLFLGVVNSGLAEIMTYNVWKGNDQIGKIHINRIVKNDVVDYYFESTVKLTVLFDIEVYDKMNVRFKAGQMTQASLYRTLNGKVRVNNTAIWNGSHYQMTNKDGDKNSLSQLVQMTTASLYFHEPKDGTFIFSEKFQKMLPVKWIKDRKYLLKLPGGNKTYYSYANGTCNLVEAETDWATLKFVLSSKG